MNFLQRQLRSLASDMQLLLMHLVISLSWPYLFIFFLPLIHCHGNVKQVCYKAPHLRPQLLNNTPSAVEREEERERESICW